MPDVGRPDSRRRRSARNRPLRRAPPPSAPPGRLGALARRDLATGLRVTTTVVCLAAAAAYVVELVDDWTAGTVALGALLLLGAGEMVVLWRERDPRSRSSARLPLLARPLPMTAVLATAGALTGVVLAAREDPTAEDVAGSAGVVVPLVVVVLMALAWLVGVAAAMLVLLPVWLVGTGLWSLVRGGTGWAQAAGGLWLLTILGYPTCLAMAGDGPRRSLGLAPLLGIESDAWTITDPDWLWPARVFALLCWGPVLALVALAVAPWARRRMSAAAATTAP